MPETQQLNIAYPPDFCFKFPRNRQAPAQEVITEQTIFSFEKMKYPFLRDKPEEFFNKYGLRKDQFDWSFKGGEEKWGGQLAYFTGTKFPSKGHPFPQALYAVALAKRMSKELLSFLKKDLWIIALGFVLTPKKSKKAIIERFLKFYTEVAGKSLIPFVLQEDFLTSCSKELLAFLHRFFEKIGINEYTKLNATVDFTFSEMLVTQIEYDNVYRLRIEDAMSETTKEKMLADPRGELRKLARILQERDPSPQTFMKFDQAIKIVTLLLLIPKYRRIFKECIQESNFENFQYDDADRYHVLLIADYNFMGKSIQERVEIYTAMHKDGFPPRITYNTPQ